MSVPSCAEGTAWSTGRLLSWTPDFLARHEVAEPRLSAELLLAQALGWRRIDLYARHDAVPDDAARTAFREMVRQAAEHKPIAYLIGRKEFYSLEFEVTPDVLIPRPETEVLVSRAIDWCHGRAAERIHCLDIGTGSGCIAIALAAHVPRAHVTATDVSAAALAVAARNAQRLGAADRIAFVEADGVRIDPAVVPAGGFDLIVSNPPYVASVDAHRLPRNVREYEPGLALFAGEDGLRFFRELVGAADLVAADGVVMVEIGAGQHDAVRAVFCDGGRFVHRASVRDVGGGHERVIEFGSCGTAALGGAERENRVT